MDTKEKMVFYGVGVVAVFVLGLLIGANSESTVSNQTMSDAIGDDMSESMMHTHDGREVPEPYPTISMKLEPDPVSGLNLSLETTNFTFAPERVNEEHVDGEGHVHLYINGERQKRLYGPDYHLVDLPPGEHHIMVNLSGNDHSDFTVDGEMIKVSETIVVAE